MRQKQSVIKISIFVTKVSWDKYWDINSDEQRKQNVKDSVDLAKQALLLDLKDGQSWYLVGNAWLSNFFVNFKKMSELETAIKAYNEAVT